MPHANDARYGYALTASRVLAHAAAASAAVVTADLPSLSVPIVLTFAGVSPATAAGTTFLAALQGCVLAAAWLEWRGVLISD